MLSFSRWRLFSLSLICALHEPSAAGCSGAERAATDCERDEKWETKARDGEKAEQKCEINLLGERAHFVELT